jgi:hypothetical protein
MPTWGTIAQTNTQTLRKGPDRQIGRSFHKAMYPSCHTCCHSFNCPFLIRYLIMWCVEPFSELGFSAALVPITFRTLYFLHPVAKFIYIVLYLMILPCLGFLIMKGNRQELKPIIQPHSSHVIALSQACPNRISAGTLMYVIANLNYWFNFHFLETYMKYVNIYIC